MPLIAGILGFLIHVLLKIQTLVNTANSNDIPFSFKMYLKKDWPSLSISIIIILTSYLIFKETDNVKMLSLGYMGSSALQSIIGKTSNSLLNSKK